MSGNIDFNDADIERMMNEIESVQAEETAAKAVATKPAPESANHKEPKARNGSDEELDAELAALERELKDEAPAAPASAPVDPETIARQETQPEPATEVETTTQPEPIAEPEPKSEPKSEPESKPESKPAASPVVQVFVQPDVLRADVAINPADLDSAMTTHTSMYVHYATQAVRARKQFDRYKNALEILEARLDAEYRASLSEGGKKATEGQIRAAITNDRRWAVANSRVIDAQEASRMADIAERAFDQRRDLLLEMARDRRKEREGELRVSAQKDALNDVVQALRDAKKAA